MTKPNTEFALLPGQLYRLNGAWLPMGPGSKVCLFKVKSNPWQVDPNAFFLLEKNLESAIFLFVDTVDMARNNLKGLGFTQHIFLWEDKLVSFGHGSAIDTKPDVYLRQIKIKKKAK